MKINKISTKEESDQIATKEESVQIADSVTVSVGYR